MQRDLTRGNIVPTLLRFAVPMILGNLLQQLYLIVDMLIVGRFLGAGALAAVGAAYSLMTFLTSVQIGLCMGSGSVFSIRVGEKNEDGLRECIFAAFCLIAAVTVVLSGMSFLFLRQLLALLQVPAEIFSLMQGYVWIVLWGLGFTFLYQFFAFLLRSLGDSVTPLCFLAASSVLNVVLDLWFVAGLQWGVAGAAWATVISQAISGIGICVLTVCRDLRRRFAWKRPRLGKATVQEILQHSLLTCVQQSVMNLGILMIQGLVNSFGTVAMAAFAAGVKIDTFAYLPAQEFGNAFSLFIAQNFGAAKRERVKKGIKSAMAVSFGFCVLMSLGIVSFAKPLMLLFVDGSEGEILRAGVEYLRIEGSFYCGIGCLFLLYGLYRAMERPGMSVVLTVLSLGTRVGLAYLLAPIPAIGMTGIWWAIPIGWFLADLVGILYLLSRRKALFAF